MNVAFKALVGSHNYNLNNENSDKDYKVFYYPSFDDLYSGDKASIHETSTEMDIEYHDIRKLPDMLWKSNVNFIEVLFSQEVEDNCYLYQDLYDIREGIASMNLPYLWDACYGMMHQKLKDADRDIHYTDFLDPEKSRLKACKSLYQVWRIHNFLFEYSSTDFSDFANSMFIKESDERNHLMMIKNGLVKEEELLEYLQKEMKTSKMEELKKEYKIQKKNEDVNKAVRDIVKRYVREEVYADIIRLESL